MSNKKKTKTVTEVVFTRDCGWLEATPEQRVEAVAIAARIGREYGKAMAEADDKRDPELN